MEIYILRDGKETGPFNEETTRSLLKSGALMINDLAWITGLSNWTPLVQVLHPSAKSGETTTQMETKPSQEPATGRQKAFLSYLGVTFPTDTTKERAAIFVSEAVENPKSVARVKQWDEDRLKLHPELFAEELRAKRENRPSVFFELCHKEGAERFVGVTKAHCQVLMGYLDVRFPNWDAHDPAITLEYFFAAIAEKFPQVVRKRWRGKFKFPDPRKVAKELLNKSRVGRTPQAPVLGGVLVRGFVVGLVILLVGYVGKELLSKSDAAHRGGSTAPSATAFGKLAGPQDQPPKFAPQSASIAPASEPAASTKSDAPAPTQEETAPGSPVEKMAAEIPPAASAEITPALAQPLTVAPGPTDFSNAPVDRATANQPRTGAAITKATEVQLRFGKARIPVGTRLKIISQEGTVIRASHLGEEVLVPIENTDLLLSPNATTPL
jgi:hypothetical protein